MCVHCEERAPIGPERVWQIVWVHHGLNKIGAVSRMVVYLVYFSCGDERFLVYQLGALCRSTLKVHKHEIFFIIFLQKPKPYSPKGL